MIFGSKSVAGRRIIGSAIAAAAVLAVLAGPAGAHCVPPDKRNVFLDGAFLAGLSDPHLESYVLGVVDGLAAAGCDEGLVPQNMRSNQLRAMFRKWLNENPERWNRGGAVLVWNMLLSRR